MMSILTGASGSTDGYLKEKGSTDGVARPGQPTNFGAVRAFTHAETAQACACRPKVAGKAKPSSSPRPWSLVQTINLGDVICSTPPAWNKANKDKGL
jgi:hypothetical protein